MEGGAHAERVLGMFINTLPLRVRLGEGGVAQSLRDVHALLVDLLRHEHAPLSLARRCSGLPAQAPLFSALLNYRHASPAESASESAIDSGASDIELLWGEERTNYPLTLSVDDLGHDFALVAQAAAPVAPELVCALMETALTNLVQALSRAPDTAACRVDVLPPAERARVLERWNATTAEYARESCLHELFEAWVDRAPDATAVTFGERTVSYRELNAQANRLARHLRRLGVGPDVRVAICVERSVEMVVALLATLKAGGAYVPMDPAYPAERLAYLLEDSAPAVLLVDRAGRAAGAGARGVPRVDLEADALDWEHDPESNVTTASTGVGPENVAYVIYTSGSTGLPKGVMNEHRGLTNLVAAQAALFDVSPSSRVLQFASLAFDASAWELAMALGNGASLHLAPRSELMPGRPLLGTLARRRITHVTLPPSALAVCDDADLPFAATTVIVAGEAIGVREARKWSSRLALFNAYGPTETTVCATAYRCADLETIVPIGRPIPNARVYVLDAQGRPAPVGVCGEIYIGGAGVARGYLNRPELTSSRFLADPFSGSASGRMYRSGDLGRWLPDGNVEFLGRSDFQVKIRGFRIELGEVEARLSTLPGVAEVVVLAREDEPGEKRLVAYYAGANAPDPEALKAHAREGLPEYMVPSAHVRLDALPLTSNGKVDRQALPAPDGRAGAARGYEAPRGALEQALAEIWQDVLKRDRVGRNDDFFELGGHSLLAVSLIERVRRGMHVDVPLAELFERPVLRELAARVAAGAAAELQPIPRAAQRSPGAVARAAALVVPVAILRRGPGVPHRRRSANARPARPHRTLPRARSHRDAPRSAANPFPARGRAAGSSGRVGGPRTADDRERSRGRARTARRSCASLVERESTASFDLERGPLIRARLVVLGEEDHVLLVTMHHIVSDGWSVGVLVNELTELYASFQEGRPDPLPPLTIQYADFASWQRQWLAGERMQRQSEYWKQALAEAPACLALPSDRPRPLEQAFAGDAVEVAFDSGLSRALKALGQRHGSTLYMTLLAGWAALLGRLAGQDDVVVGSPVAGRTRAETEPLIGFFVNTIAVRVKLGQELTVSELVRQVRAQALAAQEHGDLPFEQVVEVVKPPRSLAHTPVFQVMFAWQNTPGGQLSLSGLELSNVLMPKRMAQFDLTLDLQETEEGIRGALSYATALFDRSTIERYVGYLRRILEEMIRDDAQRVSTLPWMGAPERQRVLLEWSGAGLPAPAAEPCFHSTLRVARGARAGRAGAGARSGRGPLRRAECAGEPPRAPPAPPGGRAGRAGGDLRRARRRDGGGAARNAEGGRRLRAAGPGVPRCAPLAHAGRQRAGGGPRRSRGPRRGLRQARRRAGGSGDRVGRVVERAGEQSRGVRGGPPAGAPRVRDLHVGLHGRSEGGDERASWVEQPGASVAAGRGARQPRSAVCVSQLRRERLGSGDGPGSGATLCLSGREALIPGRPLLVTLRDQRISHLLLPPSALSYCEEAEIEFAATTLIVGGEAMPVAAANRWSSRLTLINAYGPTESTVCTSTHRCSPGREVVPIGRPMPNTRMYVLDAQREPVPTGVCGEIYIGGVGVARGYLNRPELTSERFLRDPFGGEAGGRMYRTGDLARWLPDGTIEFLGRDDFQVKVRGFRIELGEIEARLSKLAGVSEVAVLAREDEPGDRRLVAYYTGADAPGAEALRAHAREGLPEHMVPAAYVRLEAFPLTSSGKLDRKRLPAPDGAAFVTRTYEAPEGHVEQALAAIWSEVLKHERVGRRDNFFELGGHSLLAVTVIERMRRAGLHADVRALFTSRTLADLACAVGAENSEVNVPANGIPADAARITPEMLGLVSLSQATLDEIVSHVPGGAANVQDIYPLAPLQEGILFHHMMKPEGDAYLLPSLLGFKSRESLDGFVGTLQAVIHRHDILRTSVVWEGLDEPLQIVQRRVPLPVEVVECDPAHGDVAEQLRGRYGPRHYRLDVRRAPLLRAFVAQDDAKGRWLLLLLVHHLAADHTTLELLVEEADAIARGQGARLPAPVPFRNFVAQARLGVSREEHETFFRALLGDLEEPTTPFGLLDVQGDGGSVTEARHVLDASLSSAIRQQARARGVGAASVMHLAWALVLARVSGRQDVVFGTVMFGRMHAGKHAERVLGMLINTLPVRIRLGETAVAQSLRETQALLVELLHHEHAPLALAQRCSGVPAQTPLFSSLFNYRHSSRSARPESKETEALEGEARQVELLWGEERTNYPLTLSVDDAGDDFMHHGAGERSGRPGERVRVDGDRAGESGAGAGARAGERNRWPGRHAGGAAPSGAGGVERHRVGVSARAMRSPAVRSAGGANPRGDRAGVRRRARELRPAERAREPAGALPAAAGGRTGCPRGDLRRARRGDGRGPAGDTQGRRRLRAARPNVSGGASGAHAGGQRARGRTRRPNGPRGSRPGRGRRYAPDRSGAARGRVGGGVDAQSERRVDRVEPGAPRLRDLHVGLHRLAEGGDERAPGGGQSAGVDAARVRSVSGRRGAAEDAVLVRRLGVGVLLPPHCGRHAGAGAAGGSQGPGVPERGHLPARRHPRSLRTLDASDVPGARGFRALRGALARDVQRRGASGGAGATVP